MNFFSPTFHVNKSKSVCLSDSFYILKLLYEEVTKRDMQTCILLNKDITYNLNLSAKFTFS